MLSLAARWARAAGAIAPERHWVYLRRRWPIRRPVSSHRRRARIRPRRRDSLSFRRLSAVCRRILPAGDERRPAAGGGRRAATEKLVELTQNALNSIADPRDPGQIDERIASDNTTVDPKFHFVASHRWPLFRARRRTLTPLALLVGICCALLVVKLAAFVRDSESGQPGIASILALYSALILAVLSASAFLFVVWLQKSSPLFDDFSVDANGILVAPRFATPFKVPWNRVERVEISTSAARCVTQIVMSTDLRPDGIYLLPAFLLDARGKPGSCSDLTAVAALIRTEIPERVWELRI